MQSTRNIMKLSTLKQLFQKSADIKFQSYSFNQHGIVFITCDAMIDQKLLNEVIVQRVQFAMDNVKGKFGEKEIMTHLHAPNLNQVKEKADAISLVYTGHLLIFFEDNGLLFSSNIAQLPNRSPEETSLVGPGKSSRDNFIEDISVNIALIRKRLPTNSLCVEEFVLGERSKTTVALLYFDDIASKKTLSTIKKQLKKIDTDIVFSGELLMESVNKKAILFPRIDYTGQADHAIQSLVRGRFIILVDGVAYGVVAPVNLLLLLKTTEDNEFSVLYTSAERLLRFFGMAVGILLPAFWLALTTIHQDQLPIQLLATVVQANTGLPFPSAVEMLIMTFMFELFREAGLRLPTSLGMTIGVVGGLIIGDAAIRSGITSPAMIVIIALSTIATFTLVNQSLVSTVSILRIFFILLTGLLGLFGFFMSLCFTLTYISSIRIFGVPYLNIATDLSFSTIMKSFFRLPSTSYKERPPMLSPTDKTRRPRGDYE